MRVVIAGGHGQVARHLERMLAERGDQPVGLVRNPDQTGGPAGRSAPSRSSSTWSRRRSTSSRTSCGAPTQSCSPPAAGPSSGAARKETVDKGAAILLADAAEQAGVRRYVMVSSMGTEQADPDSDDIFQVYLRAKKAADDDLRSRDLDWTIVRPGRLTDDPETGKVRVGDLERGEITARRRGAGADGRACDTPATVGKTFDVAPGTAVEEALAEALPRSYDPGR